jgi:hypothetical protein
MKRQNGQALPLGIVLIMFGALLGIVVFNTGQLASEKTRLANTADAAAYSGLIWQARTLNFEAYTNRAMVANQVAIGQIVSLVSWTKYGKISARNIDSTIGWIPFLKPYTSAFKQAMDTVDQVVQGIAEVAVPIIDTLIGVLSNVQKVAYNAVYVATPEIVSAVVKRNDQRYEVLSTAYSIGSMARNLNAWSDFAEQYDDFDMLNRKADLIMRSRDEFTKDRGWELGDIGIGLPDTVYIHPLLRIELIKEGETRLIHEEESSSSSFGSSSSSSNEEWAWKGKDALSLHVEKWGCSWSGCGWRHTEIPIGWGEAYVEDDVEYCEDSGGSGWLSWWFSSSGCRWFKHNRWGESLADAEKESIDASYNGVRPYYDLKNLESDNKDPKIELSVEVEVDGSQVRTSSKVDGIGSAVSESNRDDNGLGRGVFRADDGMASDSMASISTAEVYFKRPEPLYVDGSKKEEYGSLFNPYWQVRLKKTSAQKRAVAWGIRAADLTL